MTPKIRRPSPNDLRRASSDVFEGLAATTIDALAEAMERLDLADGAILVRQGDPAESLFIVLEGRLASAVRGDRSPSEQALGTSGPGDIIGEIAVLTGTRRTRPLPADSAMTGWVDGNTGENRVVAILGAEGIGPGFNGVSGPRGHYGRLDGDYADRARLLGG